MRTGTDYRARLYERYASLKQGRGEAFDEKKARRWARAYRRYLKGFLPEDKDAPIADIGCGSGHLLFALKERGYTNLHGVDVSPEQVGLARQVCDDVEEGDAIEYLEKRPGAFQTIVALDLIEHFRKEEVLRFLEACCGALRPGGRLILQTPNAGSPFGSGVLGGDFTHETGLAPAALLNLLGVCGFVEGGTCELGPVVHGPSSLVRWALWRCLRRMLWFWNLVETGSGGSGIFTRVFLAAASKPDWMAATAGVEPVKKAGRPGGRAR